LTGQ
jgi:hypothetical protein